MYDVNESRLNGQVAVKSAKVVRIKTPKTAEKTERVKRDRLPQSKASKRLALVLTVAMGVAIPLLSLALSTISGTLARTHHEVLAAAGLVLTVSVLAVSLSHLSSAIHDITHSGMRSSWLLAVTIDLAIVLCESVHVFAEDAGLGVLVSVLMASVCVVSMALNVWGFLRHTDQ